MKLKTTIAALTGVMFAISASAQGLITFSNTPSTPVVDSTTGAPVAAGVAIAGLYFTTDLTSTPNASIPNDGWVLGATVPVSAILPGLYAGGERAIDGVAAGTPVLVQVRAWSAGFASYAEALLNGTAATLAGASNVGQVTLGGGIIGTPSTSGFVQTFDITPVPEPSTIVLGLLGGLGAMVLLRRRK